MVKIGRNEPCPCGSGRKYKNCCLQKPPLEKTASAGEGFQFESGSYGQPGLGYLPSIICYKDAGGGRWEDHFCLVNPQQRFDEVAPASALSEADLIEAQSAIEGTKSATDFALSLRAKGYVRVDGFQKAVDLEPTPENPDRVQG